jgi:sugar lactone lactonase YvrE
MKNPNLSALAGSAAALLIICACVVSCQKLPVAEKNNAYRDAVANPPQNEGKPLIGSVSPLSGIQNTVVTLSGINIDPIAANSSVTVNGFPATINSVITAAIPGGLAKVTLTFTLPPNASSGKIVLKTKGLETTWPTDFKVLSADVSTYANLGTNYIEHINFDKEGIAYGDNVNQVFRISQSGEVTSLIKAGADNPLKFIWGVATDYFNDVYVPDGVNHAIYRISVDGIPKSYIGNGLEGVVDGAGGIIQFGTPRGIAIDKATNTIYITDVNRVRKITSNGVATTLAGSAIEGNVDGRGDLARFGNLDGIAVDTGGNVYVSDRRYLNVRKIRKDGTVTTLAGSSQRGMTDGPGNTATFSDPRGLVADNQGNVYVSDQNTANATYAIRVINKLGNVTTFIKGSGVVNGPTASASVNAPNGLAFGPDDNLYIVNTGANIVSKVTFK